MFISLHSVHYTWCEAVKQHWRETSRKTGQNRNKYILMQATEFTEYMLLLPSLSLLLQTSLQEAVRDLSSISRPRETSKRSGSPVGGAPPLAMSPIQTQTANYGRAERPAITRRVYHRCIERRFHSGSGGPNKQNITKHLTIPKPLPRTFV